MKAKFLMIALLAVSSTAVMTACGDDDDKDKTPSQCVPTSYTEALAAKYPEAKNVEWERKGNYFVADFKQNTRDVEVWFGNGAKWAMTETDFGKNLFFLPPVVEASFAEGEYGTWTVDDIDYYERTDIEFYVIEVEKAGSPDTDLYYKTDGALIKAVANDNTDITPDTPIQ